MGFPVQFCAEGALPKLLIITVIISISTLARSLLRWLLGSHYFFDDEEELHISSIDTQYVESDDDDNSVNDAWFNYSSELPTMWHSSHRMHPHAAIAAIAHPNEPDATSFIDTPYIEVIHVHDDDHVHNDDDAAMLLTSPHGAPTYAIAFNVDDDAMSLTCCRMCPHGASVYAIANLDEPDTDLEDNESARYGYCCVCLCHVSPTCSKQLPRCGHVLHSSCLNAWLHHGHMKACPLCRTPVHELILS